MAEEYSRFNQEIPSVRINRMKKELEELQRELHELEKDEIPTRMAEQAQSAQQSLKTIDELRSFVHKMVDSSSFQDMESRKNLDLKNVLEKAYKQQNVDGKDNANVKVATAGNQQELKNAI